MLIGIHGKAQSGKTTVTDILMRYIPNCGTDSFAAPIKEMLNIMGVDCSEEMKNVVHPSYGHTPRKMMQCLGTEWGRDIIGNDTWVKALDMRTQPANLVISDVRMENEADYIRNKGGVIIHLHGRGGIDGDHASEAGLTVRKGDIVIYNSTPPNTSKEESLVKLQTKVLETLVVILANKHL